MNRPEIRSMLRPRRIVTNIKIRNLFEEGACLIDEFEFVSIFEIRISGYF